jgi:hypothetical protein
MLGQNTRVIPERGIPIPVSKNSTTRPRNEKEAIDYDLNKNIFDVILFLCLFFDRPPWFVRGGTAFCVASERDQSCCGSVFPPQSPLGSADPTINNP